MLVPSASPLGLRGPLAVWGPCVRVPAAGRPAGFRPSVGSVQLICFGLQHSLRSSVERVPVPQTGELRSGQEPPRPRAAVWGHASGQLSWGPGTDPLLLAPLQQEDEGAQSWDWQPGHVGTQNDRVALRDIKALGIPHVGLKPCREDVWCEASDTFTDMVTLCVWSCHENRISSQVQGGGLRCPLGVPLMAPERGF